MHFLSVSLLGVDGNVTQGIVFWTQCGSWQHLNTHTHVYLTLWVFGCALVHLLGPFCSWPIINCQARQGDGILVQTSYRKQLCWSELRRGLIPLAEPCCEMTKSGLDTRLKWADDWLCCGTDLNVPAWTKRNNSKSHFPLTLNSLNRSHLYQKAHLRKRTNYFLTCCDPCLLCFMSTEIIKLYLLCESIYYGL